MLNFTSLSSANKRSFIFLSTQMILCILEIIANVLTIVIFRRKRLRSTSYSFYFCSMVFCETITLVYSLRYGIRFFFGIDIRMVSSFFCKIDEYVPSSSSLSSDWLLVAILVDRYLTIVFHKQFTTLNKKWFQKMVIFIIIVYSCTTSSFLALKTKYETSSSNQTQCYFDSKFTWLKKVAFFANFLSSSIISSFINTTLIWYLFKKRRKIKSRTNVNRLKDVKFAISTVSLAIFDFICKISFGLMLVGRANRLDSGEEYEALFYKALNLLTLSLGATFFFGIIFNSVFYEEFVALVRRRTRQTSISV